MANRGSEDARIDVNQLLRDLKQLVEQAEKSLDICVGSEYASELLAQVHLMSPTTKQDLKLRRRFLTDITSENLDLCKRIGSDIELRHSSGIRGIFLIIDELVVGSISASGTKEKDRTLVRSDAPGLVQQQNFLFEMLWDKAIPAVHRIRELEQGIPVENTELVQGTDNILRRQIEGLVNIKKQHDACCDQNFPASLLSSEPVWQLCDDLKKRGILFRTITEITPRNLQYCKQMMTRMQLRHLNDIKGNFSIEDRATYLGAATMREGEPPTQGILSTSRIFVEMQQYFFETLWNKAIPAEQRIREIEEGISPEIVETFSDAAKTQDFAGKLVSGAERELLVMFASANEYKRQQNNKEGFLNSLTNLSRGRKRNINIRITIPGDRTDDNIDARIDALTRDNPGLAVRRFEAPLSTMITIIVVDRKYALAVELRNDSEENISEKSIGLAIYSNSKALVLSYVSIFELLWSHIELYQELKAREQIEKEFVDIAAHELRGPIQPILGLAEEIQARQNNNKEGRLLGIILRSALNLQRLADNLLDVARIQNNTLTLDLTHFDINELISSILADYAIDAARNRGIGLEFVHVEKSVVVDADRLRLYQVISNCLQNALRFSENGKVVITAKRVGGSALVSIKDNGTGIAPDVQPKLFTRFASGGSSHGTGLGLFIAKRIVEAHGGQISGSNNVSEHGATFSFSIPAVPNSESSKGAPDSVKRTGEA